MEITRYAPNLSSPIVLLHPGKVLHSFAHETRRCFGAGPDEFERDHGAQSCQDGDVSVASKNSTPHEGQSRLSVYFLVHPVVHLTVHPVIGPGGILRLQVEMIRGV